MGGASQDPPAYLPPRRPKSMSEFAEATRRPETPPYLPPRRPISFAAPPASGGPLLPASSEQQAFPSRLRTLLEPQATAGARDSHDASSIRSSIDEDNIEQEISRRQSRSIMRQSSLRFESSLAKGNSRSIANSITESTFDTSRSRPTSHPPSRAGSLYRLGDTSPADVTPIPALPLHMQEDLWRLPPLQDPLPPSRASSQRTIGPRPRASFTRISSYENVRSFREEREAWKRASSIVQTQSPVEQPENVYFGRAPTITSEPETVGSPTDVEEKHEHAAMANDSGYTTPTSSSPPLSVHCPEPQTPPPHHGFRHFAAEVGFCFTIAMTQFLAEYMISGFAIELPKIINRYTGSNAGDMGMFWPASLLSLILSATLLIFARISDMYGGYFPFMIGVVWLGAWSLVAGFAGLGTLLDVARAMQGLAVAAFTPSAFAMVGSVYPDGKRKNTVLGLYAGCAPLGFFAGFLIAGALPDSAAGWYFWIAAACSFITAITAYLTVPNDRTDRQRLNLQMDWAGAFLITTGLILISYALAVEPYANKGDISRSGWSFPMVLAPLVLGIGCLITAFWVEGWWAACPLLPFDFFTQPSTKSFCLACLCFYATYGVWLYESAQFFESESATGVPGGVQGLTLAAWYTPTAVGGLILCIVGGYLIDTIPIMLILLVSALAWVAAPLLLALCPLPVNYWAYVMPSMLCATLGIDLTFTVSCVFLSSVQPLKYQGLAGAVTSILVNLAMSFSLSISEIVAETARSKVHSGATDARENQGFRAAFYYAAASAGAGLIIVVIFVRISRDRVKGKTEDEEMRPRASSEASTLVEERVS